MFYFVRKDSSSSTRSCLVMDRWWCIEEIVVQLDIFLFMDRVIQEQFFWLSQLWPLTVGSGEIVPWAAKVFWHLFTMWEHGLRHCMNYKCMVFVILKKEFYQSYRSCCIQPACSCGRHRGYGSKGLDCVFWLLGEYSAIFKELDITAGQIGCRWDIRFTTSSWIFCTLNSCLLIFYSCIRGDFEAGCSFLSTSGSSCWLSKLCSCLYIWLWSRDDCLVAVIEPESVDLGRPFSLVSHFAL